MFRSIRQNLKSHDVVRTCRNSDLQHLFNPLGYLPQSRFKRQQCVQSEIEILSTVTSPIEYFEPEHSNDKHTRSLLNSPHPGQGPRDQPVS